MGNLLSAQTAFYEHIAAKLVQGFHHADPPSGGPFCMFNGLVSVAALYPENDFVLDLRVRHGSLQRGAIYRSPSADRRRGACRRAPRKGARPRFEVDIPAFLFSTPVWSPLATIPLYRSKMSGDFSARARRVGRVDSPTGTLHPILLVLAGGYQEPMEE